MTRPSRADFDRHFAANAPEWFRADAPTMDRLAGTWAAMQAFAAALAEIRPQVERMIELGSQALRDVDDIAASIPDAVWDLTDEVVDEWLVVMALVAGDATNEAMELGERLAKIDPAVPELRPVPEKVPAVRPMAKPLPVETVTYLAAHGQPVAFPSGAIVGPRWREPAAPTTTHFVHWLQQGRRDIAEHGLGWAEGHGEGLLLAAVTEGAWVGQLSELAHEWHGRPDPLGAQSAAWTERENAAERRAPITSPHPPDPGGSGVREGGAGVRAGAPQWAVAS